MNQPRDAAQDQATLRQELNRKKTDLDTTATFLTFEPGLYAIDFATHSASMSDVGLALPCARLEPVPNPNTPGRAFVTMVPEGGWLSRATATAHILVVGGKAGAVLTIYRPGDGTPMPEVRFRSVVAGGPALPVPQPPASPAGEAPVAPRTDTATLLVHIESVGDRTESTGDWVGDTSGQRSIEGFSLSLPEGVAPTDLEYQGIMGEDWRTPWFEAGAFCGSRGLQLPLLGFRIRLLGDAAERYELRASGQFVRHGAVGPVGSGEDCHADNQPMTAMRVELSPKTPAAAQPAPEPAKRRGWRRPKE